MCKCTDKSNHDNGSEKKTEVREQKHETSASPAIEILKERFARGEIDKAEFEEKRQIIAA